MNYKSKVIIYYYVLKNIHKTLLISRYLEPDIDLVNDDKETQPMQPMTLTTTTTTTTISVIAKVTAT